MENNNRNSEEVYGVKVRAGKRRTYFFDVKPTKQGDYYVCITESKRRFEGEGYDRHKIYVYKEDFNKFQAGLNEAIDYVKTELLPDYDFDTFTRNEDGEYPGPSTQVESSVTPSNIYDDAPAETMNDTAEKDTTNIDEDSENSGDGLDIETAEEW